MNNKKSYMRNLAEKQMKLYALKYSMAIMLMILAIIVGTMLLIACDDVRLAYDVAMNKIK